MNENQSIGDKVSDSCKNIPSSFLREILSSNSQKDLVSFAGGLPNPEFFPSEALNRSLSYVLSQQANEALQYAESHGYLPLRQLLVERYKSHYNMDVDASQIIITNGSQQSISLVGLCMLNKGDNLLLEKPSYLGAIQAFSAFQPKFRQFEMDSNGPDFENLDDIVRQNKVKLIYAIPSFQNPSGMCYSEESRELMANLLLRRNLILLEDDPYREIYFGKKPSLPIASYAPENVIHTGSFSKMISPGIRLGWLCAPKKLVPYLLRAKQASDLHTNNLLQMMLYQYLKSNSLDEHLSRIRRAYKKQKDLLRDNLNERFGNEILMSDTQGGMFLWVKFLSGLDTFDFVQQSIKRGVVFVPGNAFYTERGKSSYARFNFSNASAAEIKKGVELLKGAYDCFNEQKAVKTVCLA